MSELSLSLSQDVRSWGDRRLDNAIRRGHTRCGAHMASYEASATRTGVLLRERKSRLAHGEWLPWLEKNFAGSRQSAQAYMRLADERAPALEKANALAISSPPEATPDAVEALTKTYTPDPLDYAELATLADRAEAFVRALELQTVSEETRPLIVGAADRLRTAASTIYEVAGFGGSLDADLAELLS